MCVHLSIHIWLVQYLKLKLLDFFFVLQLHNPNIQSSENKTILQAKKITILLAFLAMLDFSYCTILNLKAWVKYGIKNIYNRPQQRNFSVFILLEFIKFKRNKTTKT